MANVCQNYEEGNYDVIQLSAQIMEQMNHLLDVATRYGFDGNLWHTYIAYLLATDENPFSIVCEKFGKREGSVLTFALSDFENIREACIALDEGKVNGKIVVKVGD